MGISSWNPGRSGTWIQQCWRCTTQSPNAMPRSCIAGPASKATTTRARWACDNVYKGVRSLNGTVVIVDGSRCRATASPNLGGIRVGTDRRYGAARTTTNAVSVQSAMSALLSSATGRGCNQQVCTDSPLEGDGFELSVPRHESRGFLEHPQRSSQQTLRWRERDACHGQDFKTSLTAYKGRLRRAAFWLFGRIVIKKLHRSQEIVMPLS